MTQTEAALVAWMNERQAEVQVELAEVLEKSDSLLCADISAAWDAIECEADRIVEKSSEPLTREQAVGRVLKTRKGAALYDDYLRAQDSVRQTLEVAEGNAARRGMDEWTRERTVDSVSKASAFGAEAARARAEELVADPQVARAFGERPLQRVEKTSRAWDEIEAKAARLVQKSGDGLSQAQAVDHVLKTDEGRRLYADYMQSVEAGWASDAAALAKSAGLNTGEGVAGPSRFGSADGEPLSRRKTRSAKRMLVELAERLERAQADGEDVDGVLAHELRDPDVRSVVVAAVDALPDETEKAASKRELRRRLEGLEESGRKPRRRLRADPTTGAARAPRRRLRADPTTGAALAKSEDAIWDEIVEKSGANPRSPEFSRGIDAFCATPEGQQLYAQYERAYEARAALMP